MDVLTAAGFGLGHGEVRLSPATETWLAVGTRLRDHVARSLTGRPVDVEVIGSAAVPGLPAKPIADLAVGTRDDDVLPDVAARLQRDGWIYRGDAGDDGGQIFVLEARPSYRVAHLHVVALSGPQWRDYLALRDLLRRSARARARYGEVKLGLAARDGMDVQTYTDGKTEIVRALLAAG